MEELEDEYAIGLDLGTTFSCIGVYRNGGVEIIPNRNGEKITPSIVIINSNSDILVGEETTEFLVQNYDNCIFEIKRLIGRKYTDDEVKKEMEKLPFKIIRSNLGDYPEVEVKINGEKEKYSPVEISSFIIKKMVNNAEIYLNRKITKLVITVPAYFNDSQRKLTKQAAELVGLKVIQMINEPTAAALSYGFEKKENVNEKILVFDLGGGTFDVSIITLEKDGKNRKFKTLATSGDTQLGGKDFDNELVNFFLVKGNFDNKIVEDKKAMKRLKVACENIKKILSDSEKTELRLNNFYDNQDLIESVTREDFEKICSQLFHKLELSLEEALKNAKLNKKEINEVILVGGSTRIPKVKEVVKNFFPKCKINDSINPDETVAYGATLEAEKMLHNKDDSITNFHLFDIVPLSLGTDVINYSTDEDIKNEGNLMSVIIKRGTPIPTVGSQIYNTTYDNQKVMSIDIYEGEKRYVKYNHLLKKSDISGLTGRPKGKTKVLVNFEIDYDGILTVKAKEQSIDNNGQSMELTIKNDDISLSPEQIEALKAKNKNLLEKMKENELSSKIDYSNLKDTLKKYRDAYNKCKNKSNNNDSDEDEEDPKKIIIMNYNNTLEEFIDNMDKNFDNETVLEKFYLYVKELFLSYIETLDLNLDSGEKKEIFNKIKEYLCFFINKSSGYLNNLVEIVAKILKKKNTKIKSLFYEIMIYLMEQLNKYGKESIAKNEKFCKYHSLMYFEQTNSYYEKYFSKIDISILKVNLMKSLEEQKNICKEFLHDIKSGAIILLNECFNGGFLVDEQVKSTGSGVTGDARALLLGNIEHRLERAKIVLSNYEKVLMSIKAEDKMSKKEAICIANILKLNSILGYMKSKCNILLPLARRVEFIVGHIEFDKKEKWYQEFLSLNEKLKKYQKPEDDVRLLLAKMKESHRDIFDELEDKFTKGKEEFIKYILEKHPYSDYEEDKENGKNFDVCNLELIRYLHEQYQPETPSIRNEETELQFCITHEISRRLSNLLTTI